MARNAEKAMTALARWHKMKTDEARGVGERRPYLASMCSDVRKAERFRVDIIREISKKMEQIQNAGLGEFRLRDLNDEINKLLREKRHWEVRILELGGRDYRRAPLVMTEDGKEVPGQYGYKYFGAARDLPGVRELFEKQPEPPPRRTRGDLMQHIDAEYFGYRDEEDGVIVPLEQEEEKNAALRMITEWREKKAGGELDKTEEEEDIYHKAAAEAVEDIPPEEVEVMEIEDGSGRHLVTVDVPSQQDVEDALVRRKKLELLEKYASQALMQQSEEAKALLGLN
ncbi:pre-mRNA-splicing factor ISY1 homolog [Paramacrobiotus metropolitanus]|uniref:pre-mRNA-splicing factor ISY1 homolog n=1 Tax=Paramacrobiotus metropolitanus TaxID=2943436 RepID=UPI002446333F|nr:pre-mRNA-splicing factor ISY1 homolog [Paramacrobiotus metropolitanus]